MYFQRQGHDQGGGPARRQYPIFNVVVRSPLFVLHILEAQILMTTRRCWYSWVAAVSMMVYTSQPLALPWSVVDLVPGATTLVPVAFAVYLFGMPLVCMPGLARSNVRKEDWRNGSSDVAALGLRLVVDLVARTILTITVYFWLLSL